MTPPPKSFLTEEQYLEIERAAEFKSEFFQGEMFAMAGAGLTHNRLTMRLSGMLYRDLRPGNGEAFSNDMRIRIASSGLYTYPDIVVGCGNLQFLDARQDTLLNPTLIIEVLSPSTEAYESLRPAQRWLDAHVVRGTGIRRRTALRYVQLIPVRTLRQDRLHRLIHAS